MAVVIREVQVRSIVQKSRIPGVDVVLTPYSGCAFGCTYCFAAFTRKFHRGNEPWGGYVDVRINAPQRLLEERHRIPRGGRVILSSVTDPYQGVEARYHLTRTLLELLHPRKDLSIRILTRSPLILRDLDLLQSFGDRLEVNLSITTDREAVRKIFEPRAPSIPRRLEALRTLSRKGVRVNVMLAPLLPLHPERYAALVGPFVHSVWVDPLNYPWKVTRLLKRVRAEFILDEAWIRETVRELRRFLGAKLLPGRTIHDEDVVITRT